VWMIIQKIMDLGKRIIKGDLYVVLVILLVGFGSFGLGRLSVNESQHEPVRIEYPSGDEVNLERTETSSVGQEVLGASNIEGKYVGSRNGTKFHFPWCGSANRIKEENKVWFASKEEAKKAGYTPAANCPGLE